MANNKKDDDMITIQLPVIEGEDDMYVGLNGVGYQIKRGVPVDVPFGVAAVLAASNKQVVIAKENKERMQKSANKGEM